MRALAAALLIATSPATAQAAPVIAVDKPCYRANTDADAGIHLTGSGFTPGADVAGTLGKNTVFSGRADAEGRIDGYASTASVFDPGDLTLRAYERDRPEMFAEALVRVALWDMFVQRSPSVVRPRHRFRFTFTGWPAGSTIYAHYLHRGKRHVATRKVASVADPCRPIVLRRRHVPLDVLRLGEWAVWYSTSPTEPRRAPAFMERVNVGLVPRHRRREIGSRIGVHPQGRADAAGD